MISAVSTNGAAGSKDRIGTEQGPGQRLALRILDLVRHAVCTEYEAVMPALPSEYEYMIHT